MVAPTDLPETINYNESVRQKLNSIRHDMEFVRREESKLHELIASLSQAEKDRLEEELTLIPTVATTATETNVNGAAATDNNGMPSVS